MFNGGRIRKRWQLTDLMTGHPRQDSHAWVERFTHEGDISLANHSYSRSRTKVCWQANPAERISANSGLARTLSKSGSMSIAG